MQINYCLHTHTSRCGHALGRDEEYVISAIKSGIKVLGFSDHAFFPNISQPGLRGEYSQLKDYVNSVNSLKQKYKNQIKIYLGFECEYFDEFKDHYKNLLNNGFDYLILGQHVLYENNEFRFINKEPKKINREKYLVYIEKALKSGLFLYIAHPDFILTSYKRWCKSAEELSYKICKLVKEYDIPLEINVNGMMWKHKRPHLQYPVDQFWDIASKVGNKVVIGYDAHNPKFFEETKYINKAIKFAEKHNLKLLNINQIEKLLLK